MKQLLVLLMLLGVTSVARAAHPFHVCIGEMDWNADEKLWEVAIRIHPIDLMSAIKKNHGVEVHLEEGDEEHIAKYLESRLYLVAAGEETPTEFDQLAKERRSSFRFIGMEQDKAWMWIYAEMHPPEESDQLELVNSILIGDVLNQENTMQLRFGKNRMSLQFKSKKLIQSVPTELTSDEPRLQPAPKQVGEKTNSR